MGSLDLAVNVVWQLLEPGLNVEFVLEIVNASKNKVPFTVERVSDIVKSNEVIATKNRCDAGRLIASAVLRGSSFEAESLATNGLLSLPLATSVHGHHVMEPV